MNLVHDNFYQNYVDLVDGEVQLQLEHQISELSILINNIANEKWNFKYEKGKWTVAQVFQHCLDTERIMVYRALSIIRGETLSLPGFSENSYAESSVYCRQDKIKMAEEFYHLRKSHLSLFLSMPAKLLNKEGIVEDKPISVASLWHIVVGHWKHHQKVLTERYF